MKIAIYSISIVLLIILSGIFSAAETAYSSLSKLKFKAWSEEKGKKFNWAAALGDNYEKLLSTILIGNNIVNISAASLGTLLFTELLKNNASLGSLISTIVITIVVLLCGEVGPKTLAKRNPEPIALNTALFILILFYVFYPFNLILGAWQKLLRKIVKKEAVQQITDDDLINIVEEAENSGNIDEDESELIQNAINFDDLTVEDALTARVDVVAIDVKSSMDKVLEVFRESGYSRLPVYKGSIDNIVGILNEKDFYKAYTTGTETKIRNIMSKNIISIPGSTPLPDILERLQKGKMHMAIVISEDRGGISGIITLEDILEELVGEIWDEHDDIREPVKKISDNEYEVLGDYTLDDFFDLCNIDEDSDDYDPVKVSGFISMLLGRAPVVGDEVDFQNLHITVLEVEYNKIISCNVKIKDKKEEEESNDFLIRGLGRGNDNNNENNENEEDLDKSEDK